MEQDNKTLHLLIVEDNPGDSALIKDLLIQAGMDFAAHAALSFKQACEQIDHIKEIQLILLDLDLPDSTGIETVTRMMNYAPSKPIIVLTGLDNENLSFDAIRAGAQDYLVKNKTPAALLLKTIRYALNRFESMNRISKLIKKENTQEDTNKNKITKQMFNQDDVLQGFHRNEFFLVYQPQIDMRTHKLYGLEALLRWRHPTLGVLRPDIFIPIIEDYEMAVMMGEWVLNTACEQLAEWQKRFEKSPPVAMNINISVQQLQQGNLSKSIKKTLKKYPISTSLISLEITESVFLSHPDAVINDLTILRNLGVSLAIDDFGKGYSSLSYLSHLPIDHLKLDIEFVQQNNLDKTTQTIVESIIRLAHELNLKVIAEGVETVEQHDLLLKQGCDVVQGFLFSKPQSREEIEKIIQQLDHTWNV